MNQVVDLGEYIIEKRPGGMIIYDSHPIAGFELIRSNTIYLIPNAQKFHLRPNCDTQAVAKGDANTGAAIPLHDRFHVEEAIVDVKRLDEAWFFFW